MSRTSATLFLALLAAGLVLPIALFDGYLEIFVFHNELKGSLTETVGAVALAVPVTLSVWYVEERLAFDWEDRVGWGLVPFAIFLGFKMNTARHLLIVLLVPDKRGLRTLSLALGLLVPTLLPGLVRLNSSLAITTGLLLLCLAYYLDQVGWDRVRHDFGDVRRLARVLAGDGSLDLHPRAGVREARRVHA